jgi:hypothetical protein
MTFAATLAQTDLVSNIDSAEAMAAPAAKMARIEEPKPFQELDVDAMTLKIVEGKNDKFYIALLDNEVIRFLLTPAEPTRITWGFDMDGTTEQRSFNSGAKAKGNENLSIRVELGSEQAEFLEKVDEKMRGLFGTEESFEWTPMVNKNDKYEKPTAKLQVCLNGDDSALTLLKFKPGDVVERGHGWDFLKKYTDIEKNRRNAFTGAETKAVVKLRAWKMTDKDGKVKAGVSMAARQLFIKPKPRVIIEEADILEDW